ncbi:MAG: AMP-binding protein [Caulobacteraceae bacterium]
MTHISPAASVLQRRSTPDQARKPWLKTDSRVVSYGDLSLRVGKFAALLARHGVGVGDRVVVATRNDPEAAMIFIALVCNGVTAVLLDPEISDTRALALVAKANPKLVIADRDLAGKWGLSGGRWPLIEIVSAPAHKGGLLGRIAGGSAPQEGLLRELDALAPLPTPSDIPSETLAYIMFTSGTTSQPKGVCISHRALFAHLATLTSLFGYDGDSQILNTLMLSHADGIIQGPVVSFFSGATLHRPVRFEISKLEQLLDAIYQLRISHMIAVPTMMALMLKLGEAQRDAFAGEDFKLLVSCGAALEADLWEGFERAFAVRIINLYGLTETVAGGVFAGGPAGPAPYGAIGRPIDCSLRIVDGDGADLPPGGKGELAIKGDLLLSGYFDDPAQTAEVLRDGWFYTGDIAQQDANDVYWIRGRKKNIIIRGGLNIHPEEIAEVLNSHPAVREAIAFGMADPVWGETVAAAVAADTTEEALLAYCLEQLEPRKVPSRIVVVAELPKGRSGKVIIDDARALLDRPADIDVSDSGADIQQRVLNVAGRCFKTDPAKLSQASAPDDVLGWDSLAHLEFIVAIEAEFGLKLAAREIMRMDRLGKVVELLRSR